MSTNTNANTPMWVMIVGAIFGGVTLLFLMALILLAVFDYQVPSGSKFLVVLLFALAGGLAAGFIGGTASANGKIPIPYAQTNPVQFGLGGGMAFVVVLTLIGYYIVREAPTLPGLTIPYAPEVVRDSPNKLIVNLSFSATEKSLDPRYQLKLQVSKDEQFSAGNLVLDVPNIDIKSNSYTGGIPSVAEGTILWFRLAIFEANKLIQASGSKSVQAP